MEISSINLLMVTCFYSLIQFKGKVFCQVYYDTQIVTKSTQRGVTISTRSGHFFPKKTTSTSRTVRQQCGFHNFYIPNDGDFPWLAVLLTRDYDYANNCQGHLISNRHVLTATVCFQSSGRKLNISNLYVIIGKYDIQNIHEAHWYTIKKVDIHNNAGIAVLTLTEDVKFKTFIRPICLWTENTYVEELEGIVGTLIMWEVKVPGNTLQPKEIKLKFVRERMCFPFRYHITDDTFCAEIDLIYDTFQYDIKSGSGFMVEWKGRWTLRGVVPFVVNQEYSENPYQTVVFSDVGYWSNWILSIINI